MKGFRKEIMSFTGEDAIFIGFNEHIYDEAISTEYDYH